MKIGLFYGSDTGNTEEIAERIQEMIGEDLVDITDMYDATPEQFGEYDYLILGLSTWHDGQLQSDWESFFETFKGVPFQGKTVALYGLGDQYVYSDYFVDGIGIIGDVVKDNGGNIVGNWSTEGYEHTESKGLVNKDFFIGLALDQDNQPELTDERLETWVAQIRKEFNIG